MNPMLNWTMMQALQAEARAEADAAARRPGGTARGITIKAGEAL
jgi:hypothetical protein